MSRWAAQTSRVRVSARFRPPLPFIPTLIGLRAFDLVSSRVWWEAATNTWSIGAVSRAFANGPVDTDSFPGQVVPNTQNWYLIPLCLDLSIIRYVSRVKWSNPGKVVANEKWASGSPLTWISLYIHMCVCVYYICMSICLYICLYLYLCICRYVFICIYCWLGDYGRGWPEGSFFISYFTKLWERMQLFSVDYSNLPLIHNL